MPLPTLFGRWHTNQAERNLNGVDQILASGCTSSLLGYTSRRTVASNPLSGRERATSALPVRITLKGSSRADVNCLPVPVVSRVQLEVREHLHQWEELESADVLC